MSLALLCPGQGAQHAAMFDRVRDVAAARLVLDATDELLGRDAFAAAAADDRFDNAKAQPLLRGQPGALAGPARGVANADSDRRLQHRGVGRACHRRQLRHHDLPCPGRAARG